MFNLINRFMLLFTDKDCYGNKINNNIQHIDGNKINNNIQHFNENKHYEIIKKVRNFSTLDNLDVEFIKKLPQKELVEIIEILNIHIERINEYINDMEK